MLDTHQLRDLLRMKRADADLIRWVEQLGQVQLEQLPGLARAMPALPFEQREHFIGALVITATTGVLHRDLLANLRSVAQVMDIGPEWFSRVASQNLGISPQRLEALVVLQLPLDCSVETIKHAHRAQIKRYHPDRVAHLGLEFGELAAHRTRALNEARTALLEPDDVDAFLEPVFEDDDVWLEPATEGEDDLPILDLEPDELLLDE